MGERVATVVPVHDIETVKSCWTAGDRLHYIIIESHNLVLKHKCILIYSIIAYVHAQELITKLDSIIDAANLTASSWTQVDWNCWSLCMLFRWNHDPCTSLRRLRWAGLWICVLRRRDGRDMLLWHKPVQRGGGDVIVRSRDHGGCPDHQRHHWLPAVKLTLMLLLLLLIITMFLFKS